jgi:hypothetical protein
MAVPRFAGQTGVQSAHSGLFRPGNWRPIFGGLPFEVSSFFKPPGRALFLLQSPLFQPLCLLLSFLKRALLSTCHMRSYHAPVMVGLRVEASRRGLVLPAGFTR